jgi:hypothetical protein
MSCLKAICLLSTNIVKLLTVNVTKVTKFMNVTDIVLYCIVLFVLM